MKPIVFNYKDHERVLEENRKLKEDIANLQIRCRIAESEKPDIVHCKDCERYIPKHRRCEWTWLDRNPEDFCSRGERREP